MPCSLPVQHTGYVASTKGHENFVTSSMSQRLWIGIASACVSHISLHLSSVIGCNLFLFKNGREQRGNLSIAFECKKTKEKWTCHPFFLTRHSHAQLLPKSPPHYWVLSIATQSYKRASSDNPFKPHTSTYSRYRFKSSPGYPNFDLQFHHAR